MKRNTEKLTDQAFSRMIITSVLAIVACVICLCSITWTWFSKDIKTTSNHIKTAGASLLSVMITEDGNEVLGNGGIFGLKQGKNYTVTLRLPKDSSSGYCLITAVGKTYKTAYITRHEEEIAKTISFTLTTEKDMAVKFTVRWGIYLEKEGDTYVKNGDTLHII